MSIIQDIHEHEHNELIKLIIDEIRILLASRFILKDPFFLFTNSLICVLGIIAS